MASLKETAAPAAALPGGERHGHAQAALVAEARFATATAGPRGLVRACDPAGEPPDPQAAHATEAARSSAMRRAGRPGSLGAGPPRCRQFFAEASFERGPVPMVLTAATS